MNQRATDWSAIPGYVAHVDGPDMPTVTVERDRIFTACTYARDALGFEMCVDVVATDYLSWGGKGVAGYVYVWRKGALDWGADSGT